MTSSYYHQANGDVQKMNHSLAAILYVYVSTDHRDWDETLHPQAVADDEETVTEPSTADGVMVAPPAPTEVATAQRPIRNKRPPARFFTCLVPFMMLLITVFNPPMVTALILRENLIFKEHVDVTFSESAWTIVTDLNLGPAGDATAYLQQKIRQQLAVADKWKQQGSRPRKIAAK
ncbi:hypothetical protein OUZ56_009810 [Daphnia magna]|uniref:Uncharacterized protein n=1 Tax=Daphnia magna TaxID=35525 RepID=A0ABR0AHC5_9CRUS|nr:hypothetical protein OUZ56_009810 [Daphnia magna]